MKQRLELTVAVDRAPGFMKREASMTTCSRRLCFSAGHRVFGHEGGCAFPHGHNYVVHLRACAQALDSVGRVIDFSVLKQKVGGWIDEHWDHAFLFWQDDEELQKVYAEHLHWKCYIMPSNPTAENIAALLFDIANDLLRDDGVVVDQVIVEETENCHATAGLSC